MKSLVPNCFGGREKILKGQGKILDVVWEDLYVGKILGGESKILGGEGNILDVFW